MERKDELNDSLNAVLPDRSLDHIGDAMPFLNRDEECKALVKALYGAWINRFGANSSRYIPVCLGLPGALLRCGVLTAQALASRVLRAWLSCAWSALF